jgi:hypothetical protein
MSPRKTSLRYYKTGLIFALINIDIMPLSWEHQPIYLSFALSLILKLFKKWRVLLNADLRLSMSRQNVNIFGQPQWTLKHSQSQKEE